MGLGEMTGPLGVAGALLEEEGHGVFVGGKEFEEGADFEALGEALEGVFVASEGVAVYEDVEARVFSFDDYVEAGSHSV